MKTRYSYILYFYTLNLVLSQFIFCKQSFAKQDFSTNFFAEIYSETISLRSEKYNTISMTQSLQGLRIRLPKVSTIDVYFKERYGSDSNKDFWNNRGELMLGIRARFLKKMYFAFFFEYIQGKYFDVGNSENPNLIGLNYEDIRYGLIFWQGSDSEYSDRLTKTFPISFWNEVYADAVYDKKDSKNFISYFNGKFGARILRINKTVFDSYYFTYLMFDKNGDFWNNKFEFGIGFWLKPWTKIDLKIFLESLKGTFIDRHGRYFNPNEDTYTDLKIGLLFWFGL